MKLYGSFEKVEAQDDGTLMVSGVASSEAVDCDGEVVKATAIEEALPDYMKFGAVREMHQASAAGTAISATVNAEGKTEFTAHVVDPVAVKKVQTGVYKGFSIGGKVTKRDPDNAKMITGIRLSEISLVDRPANPDSVFNMFKADLGDDEGAAPATPVVADAPVLVVAGAGEPVKKGMYTISTLADLLSSIQFLAQDAAWEAAYEGDGSDVPAKIRAWLSGGVEILKDVVAEETSEAIAATESILLAEKTVDLEKKLEKKGARHSKADMDKLQAIHDHSAAMGATCGDASEKMAKIEGAHADTLQKLEQLETELQKAATTITELSTERTTLQKRVTELEAQPAPAKGALKVVAKGEDLGTTTEDAEEPQDAKSEMRKVHASGGRLITHSRL